MGEFFNLINFNFSEYNMYKHYIAREKEILVLIDAEVYERNKFFEVFNQYLKGITTAKGALIFDGSISESIVGDYRPRSFLFILKWPNTESFSHWWNSSQNYRLTESLNEHADLKITTIEQNNMSNKYLNIS